MAGPSLLGQDSVPSCVATGCVELPCPGRWSGPLPGFPAPPPHRREDSTQMKLSPPASDNAGKSCPLPVKVMAVALFPFQANLPRP